MQSRKRSFIESWVNIFIGYAINFTANMIFLPMFGFDITITQNLWLGAIFTIISLIRSYCIRRIFTRND